MWKAFWARGPVLRWHLKQAEPANRRRGTPRGETFYSLFGRQTIGSVTIQISCPINRNLAGWACSHSFYNLFRTRSRRLGNDRNNLHRKLEYIGQYICTVTEPLVWRPKKFQNVSLRVVTRKSEFDINDNMKNGDENAWSNFRRYYRLDKGMAQH